MIAKRWQLRGLSLNEAERYGKPHVGASYKHPDVIKLTVRDDGAACMVCGAPATNVHHCPPVSKRTFKLETPNGSFVLRPSLFALCGSGTTGCHGGFHSGRFKAFWLWYTEEGERMWWDGTFLSEGLEPHGSWLYRHGFWEVRDSLSGLKLRIAGDRR